MDGPDAPPPTMPAAFRPFFAEYGERPERSIGDRRVSQNTGTLKGACARVLYADRNRDFTN